MGDNSIQDSQAENLPGLDIEKVIQAINKIADIRKLEVKLGIEPPEYAGRLFEQYGIGVAQAAGMRGDRAAAEAAMSAVNRCIVEIDANAFANRRERLQSRMPLHGPFGRYARALP